MSAFKLQKLHHWHIITCEYPPQIGGVSDYTKLVAEGLAEAGDEVHVWGPGEERRAKGEAEGRRRKTEGKKQEADGRQQTIGGSDGDSSLITHHSPLVNIHRELGRFRPGDLRRVGKQLNDFAAPRRLLVQWVPHGYGYRSMNIWFCLWVWWRAKFKHDRVELMVHEPFLAFGEGSFNQDIAATVHRLMVIMLLNAASQIWVSIHDWEHRLRPFLLGQKKPFSWLPVPSNIPLVNDPTRIAETRARFVTNGTRLIGHFGAYDTYMTRLMSQLLPALLNAQSDLSIIFLGEGSEGLRDSLAASHPALSQRVHATGKLSTNDVSRHVSACDVMLQPYQDGVSGRRTSVMTALLHGVPVVTNAGKATEECWSDNEAVALLPSDDPWSLIEATQKLIVDEYKSGFFRSSSQELYEKHFALSATVSRLRNGAAR